MSHSAGPWDVCPERTVFPRADRDWENLVGICDNNGSVLAFVFVDLPDGPETATTKAHLMAAAPDLLAVVKELEESSAYWSEYDVPIGLADRIRAAIAKAEGRR